MHDPLTLLLRALDAPAPAGQPEPTITCFLRDDDAGWDDERLFALLDTTAAAAVPIDLAAIPAAMGAALAQRLAERHDAAPGLLGLHQHGWNHDNHQREGRKAEFGSDRDAATQEQDLARGRAHLQALFGPRLDAWFTPPWNRCAPWTPALLAELGYAGLSRDRSALALRAGRTRPDVPALPELPVDLDWSRCYRDAGPPGLAEAWAQGLRAAPRTFGLMLHHAVMDSAELALLRACLSALAGHPRLRWLPMRQCMPLAPTPPQA